ncbi:MAG: M56 family metallopeptidase [Planctomycetota bacterium JB042]
MSDLAAWLLTYLVHSSLLIGGVVLLLRAVDVRSNAAREALWTVALFGAPFTATLQQNAGGEPLLGTWELGPHEAGTAVAAAPAPAAGALRFPAPARSEATFEPAGARVPTEGGGVGPAPRERAAPSRLPTVPAGAVPVVLAVSVVLVLLLLRSFRALSRRRRLTDGPLFETLLRLRAAHGPRRRVRLSTSARLDSPVAFGVAAPEICVPERCLSDLTPAQQEAMLAHELAHVVRCDPLRLLLARLVEAVLFLQPLNRLARRRLFETVERRCDAWALERTGRGLALAECLAEVAGWIHARRAPATAVAMAGSGSPLSRRIEGLLQPERTLADERRRRGFAPLATLLLPALVLAAPTVRSAAAVVPDAAFGAAAPPALEAFLAPTSPEPSPEPRDEAAPSAAAALRVAIADAVDLLEEEIETLADEVRALRRALPPRHRVDPRLIRKFEEVERRIERLTTRRDRLAAWKDTALREPGLARPQPHAEASPRSEAR